jgi:raffinose/stachyose/melibiose transport system permease protein
MSFKTKSVEKDNAVVVCTILAIFLVIIVIYPVTFVVITSLKTTTEFYTNIWLLPKHFAFSNYAFAWTTGQIGNYLFNSLFVVCTTVISILILGALAAYALARLNMPFSKQILFLIIGSMFIPSEAIIMPLFLSISHLHLAGTYASLIFPYIGWGLPMTIFIYYTFIRTLPNELLEAAKIDGAGELSVFTKMVMPLMVPATATNAIFSFAAWWGELIWATITLQTSTLRTLPLGIMSFNGQFGTDWGPYSAAICIVLLPLVALFIFTQRYFISGMTSGAVKG